MSARGRRKRLRRTPVAPGTYAEWDSNITMDHLKNLQENREKEAQFVANTETERSKRKKQSELSKYVEISKEIASNCGFIDDEMSEIEQKAFWINAYNALTLQTIIDHYPVKSIRFINFGLVWKMSKHVAQEKHSLGDIEHKILRPKGDPRVHFVLNCASIGCPKLPTKPFDPQQLDQQLDFETRRFINDSEKVRLDREENVLYHSELFNWYEDDFLFVAEDKLSYIKEYLNEDDRTYLNSHEVVLKKIKYDWGLNKQ